MLNCQGVELRLGLIKTFYLELAMDGKPVSFSLELDLDNKCNLRVGLFF
jgi:hypothetical protein